MLSFLFFFFFLNLYPNPLMLTTPAKNVLHILDFMTTK